MTAGTLLEWLKSPGDRVAEEEPMVLVETDKVETELEAPYSGILVEIVVEADTTVDVGAILAYIETDG